MKNRKIVLVELPRYSADPDCRPVVNGHLPNLGLCHLASVAERDGYDVSILDAAALMLTPRQVVDRIRELSPKYVGMTAMTFSISSVARIAGILKQVMPELKIILGGCHVTAAAAETVTAYPACFDVCVIGEGEETFSELLRGLEDGGDLSDIAGLAFEKNGEWIQTSPREPLRSMDSIPLPAWHLLPEMSTHYGATLISAGNRISNHLLTSRGCPGRCIFCDTSVNGHKLRSFSPDYIMEMISILHRKYGVDDIQFNDDTFVTLRKNLIEVCERLISRNYRLSWSCDARASDVSEEGLRIMKAAGCWQIAYGVESGSARVLEFIKKKVNLEQIRTAFARTKKAGITTKGFFIIGHPTETEESIRETIELMLTLDIDVVGLTFFTVFPGSPIHDTAREYGRFNPDWDFTDSYTMGNFIPHGFSEQTLASWRKTALTRFYFRPKYMYRQLCQIRKPYDLYRLLAGGCKVIARSILAG